MDTKPLLYGLIGFFIGGLIVSVAATTLNNQNDMMDNGSSMSTLSMESMTTGLVGKSGDAYDAAFITAMIAHHEGAVQMSKLSAKNAKHDEIKQLSNDIIAAQEREIAQMKQWQLDWGYDTNTGSIHSTPKQH